METSYFLTARWLRLAILNYEVDPAVLRPFVPAGTELDMWQGRCLASMVGFQFRDTRLKGIPVPFHRHFLEVNLRFYVRRTTPTEVRRGVVFVKEIVPRRAIAWLANVVYNERYVALPMRGEDANGRVAYLWMLDGRTNYLSLIVRGEPYVPDAGSEESFVAEHYWGYARQRNGSTLEYRVDHPRWRIAAAAEPVFDCDVARLYGAEFVPFLHRSPSSCLLAEGSEIAVRHGTPLPIS